MEQARARGFELVRIAPPKLAERYPSTFRRWIEEELHGNMDYLARRLREDRRAGTVLPGLKSVIVLGTNYFHEDYRPAESHQGQVSRYALTRDYHRIIEKQLKAISRWLEDEHGARTRYYVDTGPVLERAYAEEAGIGYIGKHTCLITRDYGSWVFLSVILTDLELPPDTNELTIRCGSCRRCIDACPTGAIREDRTIDARRCISYLTIENRGPIPEDLRAGVGKWLFGCDICQEVCPHNHRARPARVDELQQVRIAGGTLDLAEVLGIGDHEQFVAHFAGTPVMRAKRLGLLRNACVVAGNSGDASLVPCLQALLEREDDDMVREHAQWAIGQLRQP